MMAAAVVGVDAIPVSVEVDVSSGLPGMTMVGLPDTTVRESRDRVRTAIRNSGFPFPPSRVTVSLAPADVRKVGAAFDLPIALGILAAGGLLPHREDRHFTIVGGVSLDGSIPPLSGLLPIAVAAKQSAEPSPGLRFWPPVLPPPQVHRRLRLAHRVNRLHPVVPRPMCVPIWSKSRMSRNGFKWGWTKISMVLRTPILT